MNGTAKRTNPRMSKQPVLILYGVAFYGIWILWEFCGKAWVGNAIENEFIAQFVKSGVIKNLIWTLPAILLVKHFQSNVYVGLKEMFSVKARWLKYLPIFLLMTIYLLGGVLLQKGELAISETFEASDLIIVLFVGITEEMVFRGWLLNATVGEKKKWLPVGINAILFLFIHFPVWIYEGKFIENFQTFGFLSIVLLSVLFSWTFLKSKRIWIPVLLHMYWDLLIFLFY